MYIFVPSYPSLFFALQKKLENSSIIVITNNHSVKLLLDELSIDYLYYDFKFNLKKIIECKKKLDNLFTLLDTNKEFYLLDNAFAIDGFYLVSKWYRGKVYYKNLSTEFEIVRSNIPLKYKIIKTLIKCILNIDLSFRSRGSDLIWAIDNKFVDRYNITRLHINNEASAKLNIIQQFQIPYKKVDYLFISQGQMSTIIKRESFENLFSQLIVRQNVIIKEHPKHKLLLHEDYNNCFPDYIPAEFILGNINRGILSIYSLTLISAALFSGIKAISLLELVDWEDVNYKNQTKIMLENKSNGKIIFPRNYKELANLLNE